MDDLIDGLIKLMATGKSVTGPINIGNPGEFSILQLATMVVDMEGDRLQHPTFGRVTPALRVSASGDINRSEVREPRGVARMAVRRALEAAGVEFIDENGGGPGVRLRKLSQGKQRK